MNIIKLNTIGETTKKGTSGGEGGLQIKSVDITENGSKAITPDAEYSGMSKVIVNTDVNTLQGLNFAGVYDDEQANEINQYYKNGIEYAKEILGTWVKPTSLRYAFSNKHNIIYLPNIDFSGVSNLEYMLLRCYSLLFFDRILNDATLMNYTFQYCASMKWCRITTPNATSMDGIFNSCLSLQYCELNDVSNVTSWSSAFNGAAAVATLYINKWKSGDISLSGCNYLEVKSIHYIIQNAVDSADGATARTLYLHATAKTNWMNSEYYEEDEITRITKGIEIA